MIRKDDVFEFLMRPKFQKRSALKFDGRIIPEAKYPEGHLRPSGIILGLIPRPLGRKCLKDTALLAAGLFIMTLNAIFTGRSF